MTAITVDDERPMLKMLTAAVSASPDIAFVWEFHTCSAALEWAAENVMDIAFLDVSMRGMGGLALAERLLEIRPECKIIFCTGHTEYAVDAFRLHVSGYLMKPITAEAVQREIDYIEKKKEKLLTVRCFGNFEVCRGRAPLSFKRSKSKELLAFLVDRNGAGVTTKEICARLWETSTDDTRNMNYFYQLLNDLCYALKAVNAESILIRANRTYAVDTERIDCDYYNYLKSGKPKFRSEYMTQYSWAEETCGKLLRDL